MTNHSYSCLFRHTAALCISSPQMFLLCGEAGKPASFDPESLLMFKKAKFEWGESMDESILGTMSKLYRAQLSSAVRQKGSDHWPDSPHWRSEVLFYRQHPPEERGGGGSLLTNQRWLRSLAKCVNIRGEIHGQVSLRLVGMCVWSSNGLLLLHMSYNWFNSND